MVKTSSPSKPSAAARKLKMSQNPPSPSSPSRRTSSGSKFSSPKKDPRTPTRKTKTPKTPIVTPSTPRLGKKSYTSEDEVEETSDENESILINLPSPKKKSSPTAMEEKYEASIKELKNTAVVKESTKKAYSIISKFTGSLGGNGAGGPIYGELTIKSMQKVVQIMKEYMDFSSSSRFIDVGAGLGKPNIHVAMDPGVSFSYGIEVNPERWYLSLSNMKPLLKECTKDDNMGSNVILAQGDVMEANSFDPFTHVYMFDIGFPGFLFAHLSSMFNSSKVSKYLISYYGPKKIIEQYGFEVEYMFKVSVSMHGSGEFHSGYYYKRVEKKSKKKSSSAKKALNLNVEHDTDGLPNDVPCDPVFEEPWRKVRKGNEEVLKWTSDKLGEFQSVSIAKADKRERKKRELYNV